MQFREAGTGKLSFEVKLKDLMGTLTVDAKTVIGRVAAVTCPAVCALTVTVCAEAGAVNSPVELTLPAVAE